MGNASSYKAAGLILLLVVGYFALSAIFRGGSSSQGASEGNAGDAFTVMAMHVAPTQWQQVVTVRGRTQAEKKVTVRSETNGVVEATPVIRGSTVKKGDTLCRLKLDARQSQLNQARAALSKAKIDHEAAAELEKEGLGSKTALATMKAAQDLAQATLDQAKIAISHTEITAPFDGVFDTRMAELGDFLSVGDPCGVLIKRSPFLVVGGVSEQQIGQIRPGDRGVATLATGEQIEGAVRFVGTAADPLTRTFDVELEVPNEDGTLRDGVTAQFKVFAKRRKAHFLKRSALVLNDAGAIGVRIVADEDIVRFVPVQLLGESPEGVYVEGLEGEKALIVRGQEFVSDGQRVQVAYQEPQKAPIGTDDQKIVGQPDKNLRSEALRNTQVNGGQ